MRLLLDTNVVSDLNKPRPVAPVVRFFDGRRTKDLFISVLVLAEARAGVEGLPRGERREALEAEIHQTVLGAFVGRILSVDEAVARTWGRLAAEARARKLEFRTFDSLIAATALAHDLAVVTRNVKHFEPFGVPVLNPWGA